MSHGDRLCAKLRADVLAGEKPARERPNQSPVASLGRASVMMSIKRRQRESRVTWQDGSEIRVRPGGRHRNRGGRHQAVVRYGETYSILRSR